MNKVDLSIRPIDILFSSTETLISNSDTSISGIKLRIKIIPTTLAKDISQIKIWYSDTDINSTRINEDIVDENLFKSITYSMKGDSETLLGRIVAYMKELSNEEVSIIMKEYTKYIRDGVILDGFISGIGAYLAFMYLNENSAFSNQMAFQFGLPTTVSSGTILNKNMFQHISLPLSALIKTSHGVLLQLVLFVQSFINIWEPAFDFGPKIGPTNEARISMEIISGLSNYSISSLAKVNSQQDRINASLSMMEKRLTDLVEDAVSKMKREINNLLIESRSAIKELSRIPDDSIKEKISQVVITELESQIKNKVASEIESSHGRIKDIVTQYVTNDGTRLVTDAVSKRESEIQGTLSGLEHRVEVLYNKLESENTIGSPQKIIRESENRSVIHSKSSDFSQMGEVKEPTRLGNKSDSNQAGEIIESRKLGNKSDSNQAGKIKESRNKNNSNQADEIIESRNKNDSNQIIESRNKNSSNQADEIKELRNKEDSNQADEIKQLRNKNNSNQIIELRNKNNSNQVVEIKESRKLENKNDTNHISDITGSQSRSRKWGNRSVTPLSGANIYQQYNRGRSQPWNRRRIPLEK